MSLRSVAHLKKDLGESKAEILLYQLAIALGLWVSRFFETFVSGGCLGKTPIFLARLFETLYVLHFLHNCYMSCL